MDIGSRLQGVRKRAGLSQRELAKRVGVTNSTISLIEQNKVSPSVGSLKKVLDGIPITLAEFFTAEDDGGEDSPFFRAGELPDLGSAGIHYFLVGRADRRRRQMCILRELMPPGSDTGAEMLSHEGEEGGVVIRGQVEIRVGEQIAVLGPGDAWYFDSRLPHRFRNVGEGEAELVSASTPPTF